MLRLFYAQLAERKMSHGRPARAQVLRLVRNLFEGSPRNGKCRQPVERELLRKGFSSMGFVIETGVPAFTVFMQGIISFFSPCILPLVPLYVGYLSGGAPEVDENGEIVYPKKKILVHTLFFVVGISFAFFLLGLGATAFGTFLGDNRIWFARVSGIIMILFGLYQLGIFGTSKVLGQEKRLPFFLEKYGMGPIPALVLGFTFSFAWTPCVGPVLSSVLLMAGSAGNLGKGLVLIGIYTLGFVLPFLAVGLFTAKILEAFRKYRNVVSYTVKLGAVLLILMGIMTLTGLMNGVTDYLADAGDAILTEEPEGDTQQKEDVQPEENTQQEEDMQPEEDGGSLESDAQAQKEPAGEAAASEDSERPAVPAIDFTLKDQYGKEHTLSAYKGKTVFLNFWATWCPPCRGEMPEIQALYERYGNNEGDLIVLGIAAPGSGQEGDIAHISGFLEENGYTFPVVMDETSQSFFDYGIRAFPTTFMIDKEGNVYGYVEGALTGEIMESIVKQTMEGR